MDMMTRSECPKNSIRNNKTQLCECKNGYTGATCNEVCDNGTYGFVCGTKCECPLEECHFERGCLNKTGKVTIDAMTSTRKWRTAAWTMSGTSTKKTQVQPGGGVLVLTVLTVVSVTFVVFGLLVIYCFCFEKRKRNGIGKCPAGAQNLNLQERELDRSSMDIKKESGCPNNSIRNNSTQRCDCNIGYTSATCDEKCTNGTYGFACGGKCECPPKECHFERGCLNKTAGKVTINSMTSTMKWSTVAWTVSDTSTRTQVQSEGGVLVPIVIAVVSVTSVVIGLLIIYSFSLKKRIRNREEECHASGRHFISQERSYTVSEENVQSVVEESFKPSECLYFGETKCLQTCSLQTVTSNKDNELSQEKHEYDTQEGSEGHYNTLLLRTGLCNQTNNRCIEEAGTYSHIKALEGPTDVLLMEQYDHVNVVFNT